MYNFYYDKDKCDLISDLKRLNDDINKLKKDNELLSNNNKIIIQKNPLNFYDLIIYIDSIKSAKRGWEIKMNKRGLNHYEKYKSEKLLRI